MGIGVADYRGARGSNAGDDFHEIWVARQAIRLLDDEDDLEAITVEGLPTKDAQGAPIDAWDGVDCVLYFGGQDASTATRVELVQLKYSSARPDSPWTVSRLTTGPSRKRSVVGQLAKAWKALVDQHSHVCVEIVLVSNQPIHPEVAVTMKRAAERPTSIPKTRPASNCLPEARMAYASGLARGEFQKFAAAFGFEGTAGSRLAVEGHLLRAISEWTGPSVDQAERDFRQFIRRSMMPEAKDAIITRDDVRLRLTRASDEYGLFPCPSQIKWIERPVFRQSVSEAISTLKDGEQHIALHGGAGTGKTTALKECKASLPPGSVMVVYDCYGKGDYLDASAVRHRPRDAFLQLTNALATRLRLPLFLTPDSQPNYARLFRDRLNHAANALAAQHPDALVVIAVDAADNAVVAGTSRDERCFLNDFLTLRDLPPNVRFIVTSRTGRLSQIQIPDHYRQFQVAPFTRSETAEHVHRSLNAPDQWLDDFHHLSNGVPRIQAYALAVGGTYSGDVLDHLRPERKSLGDIFHTQFEEAIHRAGGSLLVSRLCAGLIALPRPVPFPYLAKVLDEPEALLVDICTDLAPGLRLEDRSVSFTDEDIEDFIRTKGNEKLCAIQAKVADVLLDRNDEDAYAALNVAGALLDAGRSEDLIRLVEEDRSLAAVSDPVLRREAEAQRLSAAMKVCRTAGDIPRALRFVLMGAKGVKTERALRDLLGQSPSLACRFAPSAVSRLVLADGSSVHEHGQFLLQRLLVHADHQDGISYRENYRALGAWFQAREKNKEAGGSPSHDQWHIGYEDIFSHVEAAIKLGGATEAIRTASTWVPRPLRYRIAAALPLRLIAQGHRGWERTVLRGLMRDPLAYLLVANALALSGDAIDANRLAQMLQRVDIDKQLRNHRKSCHGARTESEKALNAALQTCEILTSCRAGSGVVTDVLTKLLESGLRKIETLHIGDVFELDLVFRAYALDQARSGRSVDPGEIFLARDKPSADRHEQERDSELNKLASAMLCVYSAVAKVLVDQPLDLSLLNTAHGALKHRLGQESQRWRTAGIRGAASRYITTLLAAGYDPASIMQSAKAVNGFWLDEHPTVDGEIVARLSLRRELHSDLLEDLSRGATKMQQAQISASEKCQALLDFARLMLPMSPDEAKSCFDLAIESSKDLDREAIFQIGVLDALVTTGRNRISERRTRAQRFANVVADAAVRLEGDDNFPWDEAMSALAQLDTPIALACAARWDVEGKTSLSWLLKPLLRSGLGTGSISPPQATALSLFEDGTGDALIDAVSVAAKQASPNLAAVAEEAARIAVVYEGKSEMSKKIASIVNQCQIDGNWCRSLARMQRFVDALPEQSTSARSGQDAQTKSKSPSSISAGWDPATVVDGERLGAVVDDLIRQARDNGEYIDSAALLESARDAVQPAQRIQHLDALAQIRGGLKSLDAAAAINAAVGEWSESLAVRDWCRDRLPDIIVDYFDYLARYLPYDSEKLDQALAHTGLSGTERMELLIRGVERHVDNLRAEALFGLVRMIAKDMSPADAASLATWYIDRLGTRLERGNISFSVSLDDVPPDVNTATARFLFAYLGDCDHRWRWRSAHAVRSLARMDQVETLEALVNEYRRCEETAFRGESDFYWLAARLWLVIALDRVSSETPTIAGQFGEVLLHIALDDTFPHMLVRSFARDACRKLAASKQLPLDATTEQQLNAVNKSSLPRQSTPNTDRPRRNLWDSREEKRFSFDGIDTLSYWYEPVRLAFSSLDMDDFLAEAERWIIDEWGYKADASKCSATNRPPGRFKNSDSYHLSSHDHGSIPTLERLATHLEWHARWCAAGNLLQTVPLPPAPRDGELDSICHIIHGDKLAKSPLWSADLRHGIPLQSENWMTPSESLEDWISHVPESYFHTLIFPSDAPNQAVVARFSDWRCGEFVERTWISSALVSPATSRALVRALQTMDDSWDYGIPADSEYCDSFDHHQIDREPYQFIGWLSESQLDRSIDANDPLRADVLTIRCKPSSLVTKACNLHRGGPAQLCWLSGNADDPMFAYEAWGGLTSDSDAYRMRPITSGDRLLVRKDDLFAFLQEQEWDLIVKVVVTRRGREDERRFGSEEDQPEGRFARLYRLDGRGCLEVAEGCLGSRTNDRSGT